MSDERNADSVLFKLDTLKNTEAQQAATQGASRQMARLAAAAPASGGSGLIDIKELATLAAEGNAPAEPTADSGESLGSASASGSGSASGSASASASGSASSSAVLPNLLASSSMLGVVPTADAAPAAAPAKAPSRLPLIILSVLAVLALGAAITAIVLRG
jgi:hypothetical protein